MLKRITVGGEPLRGCAARVVTPARGLRGEEGLLHTLRVQLPRSICGVGEPRCDGAPDAARKHMRVCGRDRAVAALQAASGKGPHRGGNRPSQAQAVGARRKGGAHVRLHGRDYMLIHAPGERRLEERVGGSGLRCVVL